MVIKCIASLSFNGRDVLVVKYYVMFRQVSPVSGLLEGGTVVTISGTNLGWSLDQVRAVIVAGIPCNVIDYVVSHKYYNSLY